MKLTPGRLAWLSKLAREGPAHRARTRVGYDCMQGDLTEWNLVLVSTGEPIAQDIGRRMYPDNFWEMVRTDGERITGYGLEVLRRAAVPAITSASLRLLEQQPNVHEEDASLPPPPTPPRERTTTVRDGCCLKAQAEDGPHRQRLVEANEREGITIRFPPSQHTIFVR